MRRHITVFLFYLVLFLLSPFTTIHAEENELDFRIEPIFPDSQIGDAGYYHFKGTPGETVTLQARVTNNRQQPIEVLMNSFNAYSGYQGIVYQEQSNLEGTEITDNQFAFRQYASVPEKVALDPQESKIISFTVEIPDIEGTLLGSIQFRSLEGTKELSENQGTGLLIDQYRALNIGVQVDVTDYTAETNLMLENIQFSPERVAIMLPLENNHPVIIPNITGSYEITKQEDEAFSVSGDLQTFKMAPMTSFFYPITWTEGTLEPGTYAIRTTLDVNGNTQTFDQTFSIENSQLKETQQIMEERGQIEIATSTFPWTTLLIGLLIGGLVILIILLLVKRKPKKQRKDRKYPGSDY